MNFFKFIIIKLGDNAAMNGTIATLVSTVEALRQDVLNQAATITEQGSTIARLENTVADQGIEIRSLNEQATTDHTTIVGFNTTILRLENTVEEQGIEIRNLTEQLTADQTSRQAPISVGNASGMLFSDVTISRVPVPGVLLDQEGFRVAAPVLLGPVIRFIVGQVQVTGTFTDEELAGVRWIDGVEGITGRLLIQYNHALTSLGTAFSNLTTVGDYLYIYGNNALTS